MGGSQLKKLKTELKNNGFIGGDTAKTKKNTRLRKDFNEKNNKIIESIREKFSPFDIKINKRKDGNILGRKIKGQIGHPLLKKQIAEEERRESYNKLKSVKGRIGGLYDKRFGENNPNLSLEEKSLERFARDKREKYAKSSIFNLNDDDDDDDDNDNFGDNDDYDNDNNDNDNSQFKLTHLGQPLIELENDDIMPINDDNSDSEDEYKKRKKERKNKMIELGIQNSALHDNENDENDNVLVKKSKAEVMKEVIAKSKAYKHERQQQKMDDLDIIDELDDNFNLEMRNLIQNNSSYLSPSKPVSDEISKEYDSRYREMVYDKRSKPSERTKTDEEIAKEEAQKLKELEEERRRRMMGESNVERGPDDLDDGLNYGNDAELFGFSNNINSDNESESNISIDDYSESQYLEDEAPNDFTKPLFKGNSLKEEDKEENKKDSKNLAFVFPCPKSLLELKNILSSHDLNSQPTIIQRILILHAPSLKEGNKKLLARFTCILFRYILLMVDQYQKSNPDPDFTIVLNSHIKTLHDLAEKYPEELTFAFRKEILNVRKRFDSLLNQEKILFPIYSDLMLFVLIGIIYPTSDHYHVVVTPAMLLMAQYLSYNNIKSIHDITIGIFFIELFLKYQRISKRYVPEVISYISIALILLSPHSLNKIPDMIGEHLLATNSIRLSQDLSSVQSRTLSFSDCIEPNKKLDRQSLMSLNTSLLYKINYIINDLVDQLKNESAIIEILNPITLTLQNLLLKENSSVFASEDSDLFKILNNTLNKLSKFSKFAVESRTPLTLQNHKPIPIRTLIPKFDENYSIGKSKETDDHKRELEKLKYLVKKERKSTLREVRRDTAFLSREKLSEKKKQDAEYHEMIAKLQNSIQTEEGTQKNIYEREKKARKKKN